MKKKKTKGGTTEEYVRAVRKGSREAEIECYGHPVCYHRVIPSKKTYNRKKLKAGDKGLPYLFSTARLFNFHTAFSYTAAYSLPGQ